MNNNDLPYKTFETFVFRSPLLSLDLLQNILSNKLEFKDLIKNILKKAEINEALFLASSDFFEQMQQWINGKTVDIKEEDRFLQTIYKYLSRMSTRCTPFGIFAGCGTGTIENKSEVLLAALNEHDRHTRLDMSYLCNLANALAKNEVVKNKIRFYPNTSIYSSGQHIRYIEYRYKKDRRTHHLVQIKNSDYIYKVLHLARKGSTIQELSDSLVNDGIPKHYSIEFINRLIVNQIIINELDPTVTGEEFLQSICKVLEPIEGVENIKDTLNKVINKLAFIDLKIGNTSFIYHEIANDLKNLEVEYEIKYLFQTDLNIKTKKAIIGQDTLESVMEGIVVLNKLTAKYPETNISDFIEAFNKRYETREVALLQVLDTETGIGYLQNGGGSESNLSPLIADIVLPNKPNETSKINWDKIKEFLFVKYLEAQNKGLYEIELNDNDLKPFEAKWADLPLTFNCMLNLIEAPSMRYPAGRVYINTVGGNSAAQLFGRFCHGNEKMLNLVNEIIEKEHKILPDLIFAEIVHLPESRVGNVILRPVLRDYEIPFLTAPAVDSEHTISLDDLYLSVRSNEIILRSKRLNKRIIPRLSNAHNYSKKALPVYQFLCDLQSQNLRTGLGFSWGSLENVYTFCPRVIYKNLILSAAKWHLKKEDISELLKIIDPQILLKEVKEWREKLRIPKMVLLEQSDNLLFLHFENLISIKTFFSTVKNASFFVLKEFLFNPDNAVVKSEEGSFTNEFIFSFYKKDQ